MVAKGYAGTVGTVALVTLGLSGLISITTSPLQIGPVGVTVWFLLLAVGLVSLAAGLSYAAGYLVAPNLGVAAQVSRSLRRGGMIGGYITIILALSSLQQLSLRDTLLLLLVLVLIEIYFTAKQ